MKRSDTSYRSMSIFFLKYLYILIYYLFKLEPMFHNKIPRVFMCNGYCVITHFSVIFVVISFMVCIKYNEKLYYSCNLGILISWSWLVHFFYLKTTSKKSTKFSKKSEKSPELTLILHLISYISKSRFYFANFGENMDYKHVLFVLKSTKFWNTFCVFTVFSGFFMHSWKFFFVFYILLCLT